jgi:hypothetical protein
MSVAVGSSVEIVGVKDTLKELRALDPELRKQFRKDVNEIARPLITEARGLYGKKMPSGFARAWNIGGRQIFPWTLSKATRGVSVKIATGRSSQSVISIRQRDPAAAIMEFAGTETWNTFAAQLSLIFGRTRGKVMWQAADTKLQDVTRQVELAVQAGSEVINRKIGVR